MVSRRTWARLVFLSEVLLLLRDVRQWRRTTDEDGEPVRFLPRWLLAGMGSQIAYSWAYDRDLGAIRTQRWRGVLLAACWPLLGFRAFSRSETAWRNFSIGGSVGRIGYRLWYGVVRPLPGTDA